jgi:hypothetical protein
MGKAYIKHYMQPAFLICAAILAVAGGGMSVAIKSFGIYLKKDPWPLRKSLDLLDGKGLAPYKVISKDKIESEDVIESLGTKDYIQWVLEDLDAPPDSAVRYCSLFITYYELPDRVPHVPEECYLGSGYGRPESENVTFRVNKGSVEEKIIGKYLVFGRENSNGRRKDMQFPVLYLFNVNGDYANSRQKTRAILNRNLFGKHSYFCKIEWKFFNTGISVAGRRGIFYPAKEEAVMASQKLLDVILPILEKEHWPI